MPDAGFHSGYIVLQGQLCFIQCALSEFEKMHQMPMGSSEKRINCQWEKVRMLGCTYQWLMGWIRNIA